MFTFELPFFSKKKEPKFQLIKYRNIRFLTEFEIVMLSLNTLLIIAYLFYVTVFLNIKFTNSFFKTSDYVCYETGLYQGLGTIWTNQLYPDWWILLSDVVYLFTPVFETYILILYKKSTPNSINDIKNFNYVFLGTVFFLKVLTLITRIYQSIFCYYFQFCRICDDSCQPKFSCTPNSLWLIIIIYNAFEVVMLAILGIIALAGLYQSNVEHYRYLQKYNLDLNLAYARMGIPFDEVVERNYPDIKNYSFSIRRNIKSFINSAIHYPRSVLLNKKFN